MFSLTEFRNNYASNSGGAIKVLFNASELNISSTFPPVFENNTDLKGISDISEGKPSYYRFSFYDLISDEKETVDVDYTKWITNSTLTVKSFLERFILIALNRD